MVQRPVQAPHVPTSWTWLQSGPVRVYLPSTLPALAAAVRDGFAAPLVAHAVTPPLRARFADSDDEELEYAAGDAAATASLRLLAADPSAPPCRVVVAADVPDGSDGPAPDGSGRSHDDDTVVHLSASVPWALVASLLVDDRDEAADAVRAGIAALPAADAGDDNAETVVDAVLDHDLLWYAAQEVGDLV